MGHDPRADLPARLARHREPAKHSEWCNARRDLTELPLKRVCPAERERPRRAGRVILWIGAALTAIPASSSV